MNDQLWWYVARASGLVGWALLAASVIWGLTLSTKTHGKRVRPNWVLDLHRFLGGAAVIFTGVHVTGLVLDSYVHFGPAEILVPFASTWRPNAVAWGIVAMYLLVTIELTSLARRRLSKRVWRTIHFSSFPLFIVSTLHALTAGTDATGWAFRGAATAASVATIVLTIKRVRGARKPAPVRRLPVRERQLVG
jgi:predicted ferric reductase